MRAGAPRPRRAGRWSYLGLLGGCLAVTLPLELVLGARVWRRPGRLALTLGPIVSGFSLWDVVAISAGHWAFDERSTSGRKLPGGLPIEELAFFAVIPTCAILTFEAVSTLLRQGHRHRP